MSYYCLRCGKPLVKGQVDGEPRDLCPDCGWVYYPHLKVGAGGLIEESGKILLVKRARPPWQGYWYLPAGYVECDEEPSSAAVREVFEETGLNVRVLGLRDVYYYGDDPRGSGVLILYNCQVVGGKLALSSESIELQYFGVHDLPGNIASIAHERAIAAWCDEVKNNGGSVGR